MAENKNIITSDELAQFMGYDRPGDVERKLREQGIRPIYGRPGHFFVTLDMLNAAGGILKDQPANEEPII